MKKYSVEYKKITKKQQNKMKELLQKNYSFSHLSEKEVNFLQKKLRQIIK